MSIERPQDELNAGPIVIAGIVSAILLFALIVGLTAIFLAVEEEEVQAKYGLGGPGELRRLVSDQREQLAEYRYLDREKGTVRIPIERAMELMLRESAEKEGE